MVSYQPDHKVNLHDVKLTEKVEREYIKDEDGVLDTVVDTGHFSYSTAPEQVIWADEDK